MKISIIKKRLAELTEEGSEKATQLSQIAQAKAHLTQQEEQLRHELIGITAVMAEYRSQLETLKAPQEAK